MGCAHQIRFGKEQLLRGVRRPDATTIHAAMTVVA